MKSAAICVLLLCSSVYASDCRKCNATGRTICPRCRGAGIELQIDTNVICARCDGTRLISVKRPRKTRKEWVTVGSGTTVCRLCRGKGYRGKKRQTPKAAPKPKGLSSRDQAALLKGLGELTKPEPATTPDDIPHHTTTPDTRPHRTTTPDDISAAPPPATPIVEAEQSQDSSISAYRIGRYALLGIACLWLAGRLLRKRA